MVYGVEVMEIVLLQPNRRSSWSEVRVILFTAILRSAYAILRIMDWRRLWRA